MKIHIPNSAFIGNIDPFLANFDPSEPDKLEITANQNWIAVHPLVLAMIGALGLTVRPENIKCQPIEARSGHYLMRMGMYDFLKLTPPESMANIAKHDLTGKCVPLRTIKTSGELTEFLEELTTLLHLPPDQAKAIRYVVDEVVRNVFEHSESSKGAVTCAQYNKKSNSLRIGIADTGVGVKQSLSKSHAAPTHLEAIRLALMPGITGTTKRDGGTAQNAGAGLFFTKSIAYINRSFFMVYSGSGLYKLRMRDAHKPVNFLNADPFKDKHSKIDGLPNWQGTLVGIDMSLDNTMEFDALIRLIHAVYAGGVKDKRKAKYKRARFV